MARKLSAAVGRFFCALLVSAALAILPAAGPLAALPASPFGQMPLPPSSAPPIWRVADTDTVVTVSNASGAAIQVIAIGSNDDAQTDLGEVAAGQTVQVVAPAGTTSLGFAQNDDWLGDVYPVTGEAGQSVSVPYVQQASEAPAEDPALASVRQIQSGAGSVEIQLSNAIADTVTVVIFDEADKVYPLLAVAPGETMAQRAQPGTQLWFYDSARQPVGGSYVVGAADGQIVTIPQAAAAAPALSDVQQRQSGEGSIEAGFSNTTGEDVDVTVVEDGKEAEFLFTVAAGQSVTQRVLPGAVLWFYKAGGAGVVNGPYVVSGLEGEVIAIEAGALPAAPTASDMKTLQRGEGSIRATIANRSGSDVTVAAIDESGAAQPIFDVRSGATARQPLRPNTVLWFYKAGTEDVVNGPYTVADQDDQTIVIEDRTAVPPSTAMQEKQRGEGSIEVEFRSTLADDVVAAVKDDTGKVEPLFKVAAGQSVKQRVLPQATLWFYKQGVALPASGPTTVAGFEGELVLIEPAPAPVADPAVAALRAVQSGPGAVEVSIANTLDAGITVGVIGDDKAAVPLIDVGPGQTVTQLAQPGTALWFYRQDTGEAMQYPFKVAAAAAVSIPYDPFAAVKAEQSGPGSTDILFANLLPHPVTVQVNNTDGSRSDLLDLDKGVKGVLGHAIPGTRLSFVAAGTDQLVSDDYVVQEGFHGVDIPINAVQAEQSGPGSLRIRLENRSGFPLDVLTTGADGKLDLLFDLAIDEGVTNVTRHANFKPGSQIWFMKKMTDETVGDPFLVPAQFSGVLSIPYARQSAETLAQMGPGSIEIRFTNQSPDVAGITFVNEKQERVTLVNVPPNETVATRVMPKAVLWFYKGDTEEVLGADLPYLVRSAEVQDVTLPYNPTDDELLAMTNLSIDDIIKQYVQNAALSKAESDAPQLCWKDSYGRGVGTVPRNCPPGQEEATAGLCYDQCQPGYTGAITMCVPDCPAGFRDDGLYCFKPEPYKRDEYPITAGEFFSFGWLTGEGSLQGARDRCQAEHGDNCVTANGDTIVYETCKAGYEQAPIITNLCTPTCPANTIDIGISCQKNTYDRGVGNLMSCDASQEYDAGLCYDNCQPGYAGVGPVCWNDCPAKLPHNCGAACAVDKAACDSALVDQVLSPVLAVGSIVLTVVTAGGSTGATAGAKAGGAAAKTAGTVAAKVAAKEAAKASLKAGVKAALQSAVKTAAKELVVDTAIGAAIGTIVYSGTSIAAEVKKGQLRDKLKEIVRSKIVGTVSDERIDAVVSAMMEGAEKQAGPAVEFPWTSLDPTGIADIVIAYNHPICSDVK